MRIELSDKEMLALWKRRHLIEPLRADCRIERSDATDVDARCREQMRAWYLRLLRHGRRDLLAAEDVAKECRGVVMPGGGMEIVLPSGVVRVLAVKLSGWEREARVESEPDVATVRLQGNPFGCGGVAEPVALHEPGSEVVRVYSPVIASGTPIERVEAVMDRGPEVYVLDEQAIAEI